MKKALSILLSLIMVIGMIPMAVFSAVAEDIQYTEINSIKDITGAGYYKFADTYTGEAEGTTISTYITINGDTVIEGNGKTVNNLTVDNTSGIFNISSGNLIIRNLTFGTSAEKITVNGKSTWDAGLITGTVPDGSSLTIENVHAYVTVTSSASVAGIAATVKGSVTATNSSVSGTISTTNNEKFCGGLFAFFQPSNGNVTVTNCENNADVTGGTCVGGILGYANGGATSNEITIDNCVNNGNLKNTLVPTNKQHGVGGMVGYTRWVYNIELTNCVNTGTIEGVTATYLGGMIGMSERAGQTEGANKIENCSNYGEVCKGAQNAAGGIVGFTGGTTVSFQVLNCSNYGAVSTNTGSGTYNGGVAGQIWVAATGSFVVDNFVNYGAISGRQSGGIFGNGQNATITIKNSANFGVISASAYGSPIAAACKGLTVRNFVVGNASVSGTTGIVAGKIEANAIDAKYILNLAGITKDVGEITSGASAAVSEVNTLSASNVADILEIANSETGYTDGDVTYKFTDILGKFKLDANGTNIVPATPVLQGYQVGKTDTKTIGDKEVEVYSIRILATINDTLDYDYVGFNILINGQPYTKQSDNGDYTVPCVYTSIQAADGGAQVTRTAEELGGKYIYACILDEIPVDGSAVLTINAFAEKGTERYEAGAYTVTIQNGKIVPNAQ